MTEEEQSGRGIELRMGTKENGEQRQRKGEVRKRKNKNSGGPQY